MPGQPALPSARERFFGTWKLVSWEIEQPGGELIDPPLGSDAVGWIMYQPGGHMCAALMRANRPKFASDKLTEATPEEVQAAFAGYIGYCGSYEVNEQERYVVHRLQLSWFPNLVGTEQKRFYEFIGDRLILKTPPQTLGEAPAHRLAWQRMTGGALWRAR